MDQYNLRIAIKNTAVFNSFEKFKQGLVLRRESLIHLHDLYGQADRLGIDYLKQNPNILRSDFEIIQELIANK